VKNSHEVGNPAAKKSHRNSLEKAYLVTQINRLANIALDPLLVDALVYKNIFWWGLDMIADGGVLIWFAGRPYLLAPILANRPPYGGTTRQVCDSNKSHRLNGCIPNQVQNQSPPRLVSPLSGTDKT
jgi:hypothetical protein